MEFGGRQKSHRHMFGSFFQQFVDFGFWKSFEVATLGRKISKKHEKLSAPFNLAVKKWSAIDQVSLYAQQK